MISSKQKNNLITLVKELGKEVEKIKKTNFDYEYKADGSPLSEADKLVNEHLTNFVSRTQFKNIISEESKGLPFISRKSWDSYWMIDPIDGTKEFIKRNDDYTINIALCFKNSPIFGIVSRPGTGDIYTATLNEGSFKNGTIIKSNNKLAKTVNVVASKSHIDKNTQTYLKKLQEKFELNILNIGSSLKICMIAEGKADVYPRFAPTMEWDTCAADIILNESNGRIYQHDSNKTLHYNKDDLRNPFFLAKADAFDKI